MFSNRSILLSGLLVTVACGTKKETVSAPPVPLVEEENEEPDPLPVADPEPQIPPAPVPYPGEEEEDNDECKEKDSGYGGYLWFNYLADFSFNPLKKGRGGDDDKCEDEDDD